MEMKIGSRLTATFGAVLVLLLVICVTVSAQMSRMNANIQDIVNDRVAKVRLANELKEGTTAWPCSYTARSTNRPPKPNKPTWPTPEPSHRKYGCLLRFAKPA